MQKDEQDSYHYQMDEIDLKSILNSLIGRKLFILGLTGFITLLSLIYSLSLTPVYKSTSSFTSPSDSSINALSKMQLDGRLVELRELKAFKDLVFSDFLTTLSSREFQIKVFIDGDYSTELNTNNESIDDIESYASSFIQLVSVSTPSMTMNERKVGFLNELPYSVSLEGINAKLISRYLNELVEAANFNTISRITKLFEQKTSDRLFEISEEIKVIVTQAYLERLSEIERIKEEDDQKIREIKDEISNLRLKALEDRQNEIIKLTESANLAKSLGVIENSFKDLDNSFLTANFTIDKVNATSMNHLPEWFLYGETALLERIQLLENRTSDDPFIPAIAMLKKELNEIQNNNYLKTLQDRQDDSPFILGLNNLNTEKSKLESITIDSYAINAMTLSQSALPSKYPLRPNKRKIVFIGFIAGFMMSIFLALIINALKSD